jgi:hypothetical protein
MQALQLKPDSQQALANLALYLEVDGQSEQANSLMESHRVPAITRASIREAARQLRMGQPVAAAAVLSPNAVPISTVGAPLQTSDATSTPLALKASRWPGMGGARVQLNPPLADSTSFQPSSPTSRGTQ